jgi:hypothetical protein
VQGILPVCKTRFEKSGFFVSAGMNEQSFVPVGTEKEIRPNPPQADGHSRTTVTLTTPTHPEALLEFTLCGSGANPPIGGRPNPPKADSRGSLALEVDDSKKQVK